MVDDDSFEWELLLMLLLRDRVISSQRTHKHINTIERARASWASRMRLHAIALGRWWWLTRISRNRDSYQLCIVRANARLDRTLHVATSKQHMSIEESPHSIMRLYYSLTTTYYESDRDKRGYVCVWIYIYVQYTIFWTRDDERAHTAHTSNLIYIYIILLTKLNWAAAHISFSMRADEWQSQLESTILLCCLATGPWLGADVHYFIIIGEDVAKGYAVIVVTSRLQQKHTSNEPEEIDENRFGTARTKQ